MKLTEQQQQILDMINEGLTAEQIAEDLDITPEAVESQRVNIMIEWENHYGQY